jgi:transglutaminase-like putative cysteine protease
MRLSVDHLTSYLYDRPVRLVVQSLRLMPSRHDGQHVIDWQIAVSGGTRGGAFTSGAGDRVEGWTIQGPVERIDIHVQGTVETEDHAGVLRGHREAIPPAAYLTETPATRADARLAALAAATPGAGLDLAHALAAAVTGAIAYRPGTTHAHTTAAEALAQGEGVCQDHAQALIALARLRGMPARYVSGYLGAAAGAPVHEAAHAWAELWIEGLGWGGFDPANACCPDARYVRLGSGRDARDAAPVRGIAQGGPGGGAQERLQVQLAVTEAQQQ